MADVEKAAITHDAGDGEHATAPPQYSSPSYGSANPPAYNQSHQGYDDQPVDSADPAGLPPSYDSIFGQVRAAKAESSGVVDFFKKFLILVLGTLGCTIFVALFLAIPISMIAIGSIYLHDCQYEPYIPIYLIVGGCFGVVKNLSNMTQRIKNKRENRDDDNASTNPFDGMLNCFLFAWFIAGNVWIYRSYGGFSTGNPLSPFYCDPTLYWFAFWITTAAYIIAFASCCCICVTGCAFSIFPWSNN